MNSSRENASWHSSFSDTVNEFRSSVSAGKDLPLLELVNKLTKKLTDMQATNGARLQALAQQGTRMVEHALAQQVEQKIEEAIEWQIGLVRVHGLVVTLNKKQRLELGTDGWTMRGFIGSGSELRAQIFFAAPVAHGIVNSRVELGLCAKLLKDSGKEKGLAIVNFAQAKGSEAVATVREGVRKYTGKANYQIGDLTKATWEKLTGVNKSDELTQETPTSVVAKPTASGGYTFIHSDVAG